MCDSSSDIPSMSDHDMSRPSAMSMELACEVRGIADKGGHIVVGHPLDVLPGEVLLVCGVERVHHTDLRDPL